MKKVQLLSFATLLFALLYQLNLSSAILDGTSSLVYETFHHIFRNGDSATGLVRLNDGFSVLRNNQAVLNIDLPVAGIGDLYDFGRLELGGDLHLSSQFTFTRAGIIIGNGHTIFMSGDMTLPANERMRFRGDTIIDGQGNTLTFEEQSQFLIETNVTLTLKNVILKNTKNFGANPFVRPIGVLGSLTLDNCELRLNEDFNFFTGKLYIHNDVKITGTSSFIYRSISPGIIMPHSQLYIAPSAKLFYFPASSDNDLLTLSDKTSSIYLDGADLGSTATGLKLTKGRIFCDNHTTFSSSAAGFRLAGDITRTYSINYGVNVYTIDWSPSGQYFAVGGTGPGPTAGLPATHELRIYEVVGSEFIPVTSDDWGGGGSDIWAVNWHPTGAFLAVGGDDPDDGLEIKVYEFDGTSLTLLDEVNYGNLVRSLKWRNDGNFLAVGGDAPTNGDELQIYSWDGSSLALVDGADYGTGASDIIDVEWSPDGQFIAVGGDDPDAAGGFGTLEDFRIYSFNGTTLTAVVGETFGTAGASNLWQIAWRPDGNFIAIGGHTPEMFGGAASTHELQIYGFDGSTLTPITSVDWGNTSSSDIFSLDWSPDSFSLAVGGDESIDSTEFRIYSFDGTNLNITFSVDYGPDFEADVWKAKWKPDGEQILIGGETAAIPEEIQLYEIVYVGGDEATGLNASIILGDKDQGSASDVDVKILGAATLDIFGKTTHNSTA